MEGDKKTLIRTLRNVSLSELMKMVTRACEVREVGRKAEESNSKKSKRGKSFKDVAVVNISQTK